MVCHYAVQILHTSHIKNYLSDTNSLICNEMVHFCIEGHIG